MDALVYDPDVYDTDLLDRFASSINSEGVFAKEPNIGLLATYPLDRSGASKVEQVLRILMRG
jgi:hypothetical protein